MKPVLIVGAGPVGAVCALILRGNGIPVRVFEAQPRGAARDSRTLALAYGAQLALDRIGAWRRLARVTPITGIHISQRGAPGVARLSAREFAVPALGYVLSYAELAVALEDALDAAGVVVDYATPVASIQPGEDEAGLTLADGGRHAASLVVVADGGRGDSPPAPTLAGDYGQRAIVCEVETELPHGNLAYERFTPDGPAALLPKGDRYALVWSAADVDAERILALPDAEFLAALYRHFGGRRGHFLAATPRNSFPLRLAYLGAQTEARVVRVGNAAQILHPVAGQGFNLGLRDAWELAEACIEAVDSGSAPGSRAMLAAYQRGRRADIAGGMGFTDFLVRAFSGDNFLLSHARGLGLLALEALPPLKSFVARRMMYGANG